MRKFFFGSSSKTGTSGYIFFSGAGGAEGSKLREDIPKKR